MRAAVLSLTALFAATTAQAQTLTTLVPGSAFHGVHGVRFAPNGELYAGSVIGQTLYAVNPQSGAVRVVEGPPHGMADDIAFGAGGQVVWTAISTGTVYTRRPGGPVEVLAKDLPGANSVAFSRDGKRLFLGQVFAGDGVWELDPAGVKPPRKITSRSSFASLTMCSLSVMRPALSHVTWMLFVASSVIASIFTGSLTVTCWEARRMRSVIDGGNTTIDPSAGWNTARNVASASKRQAAGMVTRFFSSIFPLWMPVKRPLLAPIDIAYGELPPDDPLFPTPPHWSRF